MLTFIGGVLVLIASLFGAIFGSMALLMLILLSLAVTAVYLCAIFSILLSRKSAVEKVLWLVFVVLFPVLGLLAWVLIGRKIRPVLPLDEPDVGTSTSSSRKINLADLDADQLRDVEAQLADIKARQSRDDKTGDSLRKGLGWNRDDYRKA